METVKEKSILITILGCLESIKLGGITIEECQRIIFSPYFVKQLHISQCNEKIIIIIQKACELEDIASILPHKLSETIADLKQETLECLKGYREIDYDSWHNFVVKYEDKM